MRRVAFAWLLLASIASAQTPTGTYITIAPECRVANINGNCGWASLELIARHQGISELYNMSHGRGGTGPTEIAAFLKGRNVEFWQCYSNARDKQYAAHAWGSLKHFLDRGRPVMFSIPGHALVCCGVTTTADNQELVWVIDNTGPEGCKPKGWTRAEFDSKFDGWVCGIIPFRLRPSCPGPDCRPYSPIRPHVDPSPQTIPLLPPDPNKPPAVMPPAPPAPSPNDDITKALKALSDKIDSIQLKPGPPGKDGKDGESVKGDKGDPGKDADTTDLSTLRQQLAMLESLMAKPMTAILLDSNDKVLDTVQFSPTVPLRLRLKPVMPPK